MKGYTNAQGVFDPGHALVTSYAFPPKTLSTIRLVLALYITFTIVFTWVQDAGLTGPTNKPQAYLSYFTHLSYIGLAAYFWASGLHTFAFSRHRTQYSYPLQHWSKVLQYLYVLLRSTIVTFPIVVTIVFWALIASASTFATPYSTWSSISQHALNIAFSLFETALTNGPPPPWAQLPVTLLFLGGYLAIAYITRATQGFYPYTFLDPKNGPGWKLAMYIVGITLLQCVVFSVIYGLTVLRERLVPNREKATSGKVLEDDDGVQYFPLQHSDRSVGELNV